MIPDSHYEWLYRTSAELDVSVAEIVRRALDYWISLKTDAAEGPRPSDPDTSAPDLQVPADFGKAMSEAFKMMEYIMTRSLTPEEHAELEAHAGRQVGREGFVKLDPEVDKELGERLKPPKKKKGKP